jgi:hypothetical protein
VEVDARFDAVCAARAAALGGLTALRAALGRAVEDLLLIDRALFLAEALAGCSDACVRLLPLFDPAISPRCLVLVAERRGGGGAAGMDSAPS